jgi:23S rRNA G2069 N7-methylase RlmK/C1962 C5-methylase RlmI
VSDAWRVVHSEGDGLSGLVVDRYGDLVVVEFFAAGMFRHREWIYDALREQFPGCRSTASPTSTCRSRKASISTATPPPKRR